ncbi:hypothetical protein [Marinobacterium aestuariivivens]|uniref:Transglycosylase SLT domain-containing protein n=1 Tax=Marinobacterium aestuariivivens TaxID=1698799 RepID=A0ABW2A6N0_9GAMM
MRWHAVAALICGVFLVPAPVGAAELALPVAVDYRILERALGEQLFTGPGGSVEVLADARRCNTLVLSSPRVEGAADGRIRVLAQVDAQIGTPVGELCMLPIGWSGLLETLQTPYVDTERSQVHFRLLDSNILRLDDEGKAVPGILWDWVKRWVHPRFEAVTLDLAPAVDGIGELMTMAVAAPEGGVASEPLVWLEAVTPAADTLEVLLGLVVADPAPDWRPARERPLTEEELAHWDANWQAWDGFATWLIKTVAADAEPQLARALADILLEARYDLRDALAADDRSRDPVRDLFLRTWARLAPLLEDSRLQVPGIQALQFAAFVSAADALRTLDSAAPHLGMRLDSHSLRALARLLVPGVGETELDYGTEVDPALRRLLGLDPELSGEEGDSLPFAWLIPAAHAGPISPALVKQLTAWVPAPAEIDAYLEVMDRLLEAVIDAEKPKGKVPERFFDIYADLLRATAWQESCWRQYVERDGQVRTLLSPGGAIGLMQINRHVWRGVYDIGRLQDDVGYNARAGNEILVHYLVDFAIRKREHEITGDPHNLARATYGVYNGGPAHLRRYRKAGTSKTLQAIDAEFWRKYQAIGAEGAMAVKQCYGI